VLWGCNAPDSFVDSWCYINSLLSYLLIYFFKNMPVSFPGRNSVKVTEPGFSFFVCLFCVVVYFVVDECLCLLC